MLLYKNSKHVDELADAMQGENALHLAHAMQMVQSLLRLKFNIYDLTLVVLFFSAAPFFLWLQQTHFILLSPLQTLHTYVH